MSIIEEKRAAGRIIDRALAKGHLISVNDGEEWVVKNSTRRREIMDALQSTDADTLLIRNSACDRIGMIYLVWGNSPDEVVCDHSDNAAICEVVGAPS